MPEKITPKRLTKAAKYAAKVYKRLKQSSGMYQSDAKSKYWKHFYGEQASSNIGSFLTDVFVDETYKACDSLFTRLKLLAPGATERFDYMDTQKGIGTARKLKRLKSFIANDLHLMKYDLFYKRAVENYTVEGTMWTKLEWDMNSKRKMRITEVEEQEVGKKPGMLKGEPVEVPYDKTVTRLKSDFYDEERDRGRMVPCKYERIYVDVESGEDLEDTALAHWVTTDFETLEDLEYDKESGEGIYYNISKLKKKIFETLTEDEKKSKVEVDLIELWDYYDIYDDGNPILCVMTISKEFDDICVRLDENPYPFDHKPFYKTVLFRRNGKQLGIGIPEKIWNKQVQINDAMTMMYENVALRAYGMGFYSMTAGLTDRQMKVEPRKLIGVADPNNAYKAIEFLDVSGPLLTVVAALKRDVESDHGIMSSIHGQPQVGVDTATEFELLLQQSTEKIKDFLSNVEETTIEPFLNDYILLVFENWEDYGKRSFPVLGEDAIGVQSYLKEDVFAAGFESLRFKCLGAMKMERDAVTNKRVYDTYVAFREDGTVPPSGKWYMKVDLLRSLHPNLSEKEILERLGPKPDSPKKPFVAPLGTTKTQGGQNQTSLTNQRPPTEADQLKGAIQGQNIQNTGTGQ